MQSQNSGQFYSAVSLSDTQCAAVLITTCWQVWLVDTSGWRNAAAGWMILHISPLRTQRCRRIHRWACGLYTELLLILKLLKPSQLPLQCCWKSEIWPSKLHFTSTTPELLPNTCRHALAMFYNLSREVCHTLNKNINATLVFDPIFLWAELKDRRLFISNILHKSVYICVSGHFSVEIIHPPDRCGTSRCWLDSMIITQVCLRLTTIKGL